MVAERVKVIFFLPKWVAVRLGSLFCCIYERNVRDGVSLLEPFRTGLHVHIGGLGDDLQGEPPRYQHTAQRLLV